MRVGIATLAAGRGLHLRRQAAAVGRLAGVARYVVVSMDREPPAVPGATVILHPAGPGGLPLAAARNRAVEVLSDCDLVILLDVDCIPSQRLMVRYRAAAHRLAGHPALLCGPVGYLDPLRPEVTAPDAASRRRARARVIRDFPCGGIRPEPRPELFWSLSFAVTPRTHRLVGGFDESYVGYGAEDTDYGMRAARAGVGLWFVAGAWAYHQHHPPSDPGATPEVLANATRFHDRWGYWPMPERLAGAES